MKVALCIPTLTEPYPQTVAAVDASIPLLKGEGHVVGAVTEIGSAYISWARGSMLGKALAWGADAIVFIDHDLSWRPGDLLRLVSTPGDVVAGNYRYKDDSGDFMGVPLVNDDGKVPIRSDGCIPGKGVPAGFLKITPRCVERFREAYPELICDNTDTGTKFVDLFNHGAHQGVWYGEDFAFSRRWRECGGDIWLQPDLTITHHTRIAEYPGNYREWLEARTVSREPLRRAA